MSYRSFIFRSPIVERTKEQIKKFPHFYVNENENKI